jgi:hypothetical protein
VVKEAAAVGPSIDQVASTIACRARPWRGTRARRLALVDMYPLELGKRPLHKTVFFRPHLGCRRLQYRLVVWLSEEKEPTPRTGT